METRVYEINGKKENLDALEKALRHIEYLGKVGASRNILIRVDGDGDGRIQVNKVTTALIRDGKPIDFESYNLEQKDGPIVGVYDIE